MGAFDATNSHNPFDPDPPYQSCCQLNPVSGDEELQGESMRSGRLPHRASFGGDPEGSAKG